LVLSASCGSLEAECRRSWAPAVDAIVTSSLAFHGYQTIEPSSLRKDTRERQETSTESEDRRASRSNSQTSDVSVIAVLPAVSKRTSGASAITVTESREKTVVLEGANFDDLSFEERSQLLKLADANSLLSTYVIVGANYNVWTSAQNVEVVIKLADATNGEMRWSSRCSASSADFPNVEVAIERAARCAASATAGAK
jgi:hypothetical protein